MAIIISGNGIDMGQNAISNASQVEVQEQQVSPFSGFKNFIINGNFDIWQRGASQTIVGYGSADRWYVGSLSNTIVSKAGGIDGYSVNALAISANNAINNLIVSQALESFNTKVLKNKTVTLSFNYNSSVTQPNNTLAFSLQGNSTGDTMTGGFWETPIQISKVTPTSSVQRASMTVTIPSTASGLRVNFQTTNIINGSSVNIYNVQLEEGSVATPFEQRPYGLELSLCQRYCAFNQVNARFYSPIANSVWSVSVPHPVEMRVNPTCIITSPTGQGNISTLSSECTNIRYNIITGIVTNIGAVDLSTGMRLSAEF